MESSPEYVSHAAQVQNAHQPSWIAMYARVRRRECLPGTSLAQCAGSVGVVRSLDQCPVSDVPYTDTDLRILIRLLVLHVLKIEGLGKEAISIKTRHPARGQHSADRPPSTGSSTLQHITSLNPSSTAHCAGSTRRSCRNKLSTRAEAQCSWKDRPDGQANLLRSAEDISRLPGHASFRLLGVTKILHFALPQVRTYEMSAPYGDVRGDAGYSCCCCARSG